MRDLALILAGGRGNRMDVLCQLRPKPALPFAGRFHVIDFSISNCIHSDIKEIAVLTDYQRTRMARYLERWNGKENRPYRELHILEPENGAFSGTAGAVYQNLEFIEKYGAERVIILAGDHVYKMDYRKMLSFHNEMKAEVTVGISPVPLNQTHHFGIVSVDTGGRIESFVEKPERASGNMASMGIYIFNKDVLCDCLKEDANRRDSAHDFGYSILPGITQTHKVFGYEYDAYWQDIGNVISYYRTNMDLIKTEPPFSLNSNWPVLTAGDDLPRTPEAQKGTVVNSIISPGCVIDGYVENSILSPGVHVEEKAEIWDSVLMEGVSVGYHSVVDRCILDEGVKIGKFCYIGFGRNPVDAEITVLGEGVIVPSYTAVGYGSAISPHVTNLELDKGLVPPGSVVNRQSRGHRIIL